MGKASEVVYGLKPVTFKYKTGGGTQYGLIAEEVAEVAPDLVFRDDNGEVNTVRFEQVGSLLLNEFLKEHKKVEEQQASIAELKSTVAQQQKGMEILTAQLKEQAAQIQKVSAQLEVSKPATKVAVGNSRRLERFGMSLGAHAPRLMELEGVRPRGERLHHLACSITLHLTGGWLSVFFADTDIRSITCSLLI